MITVRQPEVERAFSYGFVFLRKRAQMTAGHLAAALTVSHRPFTSNMLSHYETGRVRVTLADARAIAAALGTDVDAVIDTGRAHRAEMAAIIGRWPV